MCYSCVFLCVMAPAALAEDLQLALELTGGGGGMEPGAGGGLAAAVGGAAALPEGTDADEVLGLVAVVLAAGWGARRLKALVGKAGRGSRGTDGSCQHSQGRRRSGLGAPKRLYKMA